MDVVAQGQTAARSTQGSLTRREPCGSGFIEASNRREEDHAVHGTGFAGVRG